ncbi:MAG: TldD/PmbA family protein [Chloroflexi bacterium]|nr:TldD/PmbA family protein [Chloroflexota bacterium]
MIEQLLNLAQRHCEAAEVFSITQESTPVRFETNRLKEITTRSSQGVALRLIKDGRIGFAASWGEVSPRALVDMALETAPLGAAAHLELPSLLPYPSVEIYDPADVAVETMVQMGQSLIDRVRQNTPDLQCEAHIGQTKMTVDIINSQGGRGHYEKSVFGVGIEGTLIRGTDMLFVGDSFSSCQPIPDFAPIAETTLEQLELAKETTTIKSGQWPVVFTPRGVAGALLSPLLMGFNGKIVWQGASPLVNKLGQRLFDPRLNLWDDATIPLRPGSRPCDDEGVPSQRITLIDQGAVAHFLYDLQTAALSNTQSTGSASRALTSLPSPASSTIIMGEGETPYADMIANLKEGLVVEELMGAGQGNVLGGEFSGNVLLGYKVEGGKIVGRVKDTMVSGNIYQALANIIAIGKESLWVGGAIRLPALCLGPLMVASKG